jgi:hypothetical protein
MPSFPCPIKAGGSQLEGGGPGRIMGACSTIAQSFKVDIELGMNRLIEND